MWRMLEIWDELFEMQVMDWIYLGIFNSCFALIYNAAVFPRASVAWLAWKLDVSYC
jgi:hypothetical protein